MAIPLTEIIFDPVNVNLSLKGLLILVASCFLSTLALIKLVQISKPDYTFPLTGKRLVDIKLKAATGACIGFSLAFAALLFLTINTTLLEPCRSVRCNSAEVLFGTNEQINGFVFMVAFLLNAFFSLAVFSAMGLAVRFTRKVD
ncbi:MAG TPA: hypothetical protein VM144_03390 [Aestuariivirga sp.]|nr:hypothetical protein [Aestuariivirga sp.]